MKQEVGSYYIGKLQHRVALMRIITWVLLSFSIGCVIVAVLTLLGVGSALAIGAGSTMFFFIITCFLRDARPTAEEVARFLDFNYEELENSSSLTLRNPENVSGLESLQREKVNRAIASVYPKVRIPRRNLVLMATVLLISMAFLSLALVTHVDSPDDYLSAISEPEDQPLKIPGMEDMTITISPPTYTGIMPFRVTNVAPEIPAGSKAEWKVIFSEAVKQARLIIGNADTIQMRSQEDIFLASVNIFNQTFFQICWEADSAEHCSKFFNLLVIGDKNPEVSVLDLPQFMETNLDDKLTIPVSVRISDDYGLTGGYLIATVSKGEGESVKFREEKIAFETPMEISGKNIIAKKNLGLSALGLEPGDELYFYVMAFDNCRPTRQYTRSETFFISLKDTAEVELSYDAGLGVDLMPEYFRSQRQIIIDTENLLAQKKTLNEREYKSRSNELAHDQKVLRLRYGQFLGEEFESDLIAGDDHDHEETKNEPGKDDGQDVVEKFGHAHDTENEHNAVEEVHRHDGDLEDPEEKEDPLEGFIHRHDDPEEATFFTQSIRAKLKATLSIMWDAELHLRLSDPKKSLPFQYKALKLLKEISNDSRIYVHRTGFDAPPIKEEKRLTGDLTEIKSSWDTYSPTFHDPFKYSRLAISVCDGMRGAVNDTLTRVDRDVLMQAGVELGKAAIENPGKFLDILSMLQKMLADSDKNNLRRTASLVRTELRKVVPPDRERSHRRSTTQHALDSIFVRNLLRR